MKSILFATGNDVPDPNKPKPDSPERSAPIDENSSPQVFSPKKAKVK